jgi:hypothetical protein
MDWQSLACSGVRARRYGGEPTWQVAHDVARWHVQPHKQFHLAYFKWSFLTFFKHKCSEL